MLNSKLGRKRRLGVLAALGLLTAAPAAAQSASGCYATAPTYNVGGIRSDLFIDGVADIGAYGFDNSGSTCAAAGLTSARRWETQASVGLAFALGDAASTGPRLTLGVRRVAVNSEDRVYGAEVNLWTSLREPGKDTQMRLLGIAGNRKIQANGGIGWDIDRKTAFGNVGLQVPYLRLTTDLYGAGTGNRTFIEMNTYGALTKQRRSLRCGTGTLMNGEAILAEYLRLAEGVTGYAHTGTGTIFAGSETFPDLANLYPGGDTLTYTYTGTASDAFNADGLTCADVSVTPG